MQLNDDQLFVCCRASYIAYYGRHAEHIVCYKFIVEYFLLVEQPFTLLRCIQIFGFFDYAVFIY